MLICSLNDCKTVTHVWHHLMSLLSLSFKFCADSFFTSCTHEILVISDSAGLINQQLAYDCLRFQSCVIRYTTVWNDALKVSSETQHNTSLL